MNKSYESGYMYAARVSVYLFDGEVVDQVVVVFVEAAVQRYTVGVEEQVLNRNTGKTKKSRINPQSSFLHVYIYQTGVEVSSCFVYLTSQLLLMSTRGRHSGSTSGGAAAQQ